LFSLRSFLVVMVMGSAGAAPGTRVPDSADCPGVCEVHVGYSVDPSFSDEERGVIADAARAWERGSNGRVCFYAGGRDLSFVRVEEPRDLAPEDPDWAKHVALCKAGRIWFVASRVDDRDEYVALAIHEIGHFLGLSHIEDTTETFMHSTISETPDNLRAAGEIPERDRRELCRVRACVCR
jgi:hypothetical protein